MSTDTSLMIRVLEDFEDPALDSQLWERLLASGSTDVPFLTLEWQRAWWRAFGGDRLLIVAAERGGQLQALAPLFALDDMLFLVGSGGSDYLDLIGDVDAAALSSMLAVARDELPEFEGLTLFHVPLTSKTTSLLPRVAKQLDLELVRESDMLAPYLDLTDAEQVAQSVNRRKLRKEESRMGRDGPLQFRRAREEDLDPWLDRFFEQHAARWSSPDDAPLDRGDARAFCRAVVHSGHRAGWLRFTMLEWRERPAAFDITLARGDRQVAYLVSRDTSITKYSPGKILERYVIRDAIAAGARCYDFGLGDEDYKLHHASGVSEVVNWSLYP